MDVPTSQSDEGDVIRFKALNRSFRILRSAERMDCSTFWDLFARGEWEPRTLAMIDAVAGPGTTFYDIGSWVGPTALWAATRGGAVIAFEPDPVALSMLRANVSLNPAMAGRIEVVPAAAGDRDGMLKLHNTNFGNSESSVFPAVQRSGKMRQMTGQTIVPMFDLIAFINRQGPQVGRSFIKMDIEGAEFDLVPALKPLVSGYDIPLCVTFHPYNVTGGSPADTLLRRVAAMACALRPYAEMVWSVFDGDRFLSVDQEATTKDFLNNLSRNSTIVISNREMSAWTESRP